MAGQIEQGFGEEPRKDPESIIPTIHIETDAFDAEVISLYDMPGMQVLDVFTTPGIAQMPKMVDLFRLSIYDPERAGDVAFLSFSQLAEVVGQWVSKSQENGGVDFSTFS